MTTSKIKGGGRVARIQQSLIDTMRIDWVDDPRKSYDGWCFSFGTFDGMAERRVTFTTQEAAESAHKALIEFLGKEWQEAVVLG